MGIAPPRVLDGARVRMVAHLGTAQRPTRATRHSVRNFNEVVANLAIAQYDGDTDVCLFYCTEEWEVVTDTCHQTQEQAVAQAEFEFTGLTVVSVESDSDRPGEDGP